MRPEIWAKNATVNCLKEGETEPAWLPYKMMPAQMDVRWWCAARGVERIDQIRETVDDKFAEILDLLSIEKEDFEESNWLVFARIMVLSHKATLNLEKTDLRFNQVLPVLYSIYYEYNEVLDKNDKSLVIIISIIIFIIIKAIITINITIIADKDD